MKRLLKQLAITLPLILPFTPSPAQDLLGRWELRGTYLEIGYTQVWKWKVVRVRSPKTRFKASDVHTLLEFHDDGRVKLGDEWSTYSIDGNRILTRLPGLDTNGCSFHLSDNGLTLWLHNQAEGLSKRQAKDYAIIVAKKTGLYNQFSDLTTTDEVYSIRLGLAFEYEGEIAGQTEGLVPLLHSASQGQRIEKFNQITLYKNEKTTIHRGNALPRNHFAPQWPGTKSAFRPRGF